MNIIPDPVMVLAQMAPFLVLLVGLHLILFKPLIAYLDERDGATLGAKKEAEALQAQAAAATIRWEQELGKARNEVAEFRGQKRAEAQAEYQRVVAAARAEAEARIAEASSQIRAEADSARVGLKESARQLSNDVATQVLGRPLSSGVEVA